MVGENFTQLIDVLEATDCDVNLLDLDILKGAQVQRPNFNIPTEVDAWIASRDRASNTQEVGLLVKEMIRNPHRRFDNPDAPNLGTYKRVKGQKYQLYGART